MSLSKEELSRRDTLRKREKYRTDPAFRAHRKAGMKRWRDANRAHVNVKGKEAAKRWREANPDRNKNNQLQRTYGISLVDYNAMLERQAGLCAICAAADKSLVVDHDHVTGKVRGLLCHGCNVGIGLLGDTFASIMKAAVYLGSK